MRIALVTGAGSGIGRAGAIALLRDGFQVFLAGRREKELEKTATLAEEFADAAHVAPADVSDAVSVERLFRAIHTKFGRLDVLFNNAGTNIPPTPADTLSFADFSRVLSVNVSGMFLCAQQALRLMKTQNPAGGRIINNGSVSARVPRVNALAYTVSKHAVTGLTKSISLDFRDQNICCSQIDIGNAASGLAVRYADGMEQPDGTKREEATMDVEIVASAVVFLANLPLTANVPTMTLMANAMPYMGRG
jgi:NAD(P)-dependent dehydrogenase (short-subunit alcohol dehydrogenase family)